jgi:hypothetical protein
MRSFRVIRVRSGCGSLMRVPGGDVISENGGRNIWEFITDKALQ